ncbi:hypothetical protein [Amphritea balenae]|uniref:Uncharacterized protein n=1 Tax=Amphritea balenae TaxID=452629 RepID=A0A3P1SWY4_9GAMM|nr:hypothetical protein [Amphritea balenae]RRD01650.1 hypothetical protein EHS89_03595 [Amphritea balenae]GGK55296.1 hypothetical protein GCM10007941_01700 [Amphritea balenae]
MNQQHAYSKQDQNSPEYQNQDWPRDFDFRTEVAEQQEIITPDAANKQAPQPLTCSEYDF